MSTAIVNTTVEDMAKALLEASKVNNPVLVQQIAAASSEKTVMALINTIQGLQVEIKMLSDKVDAMASAKKAPAKKAPVETQGVTVEGQPPAVTPAVARPPIKTAQPAAPGSFKNRSLFLKHAAKTMPDWYNKTIPASLIEAARKEPSYMSSKAKLGDAQPTAEQAAILLGYEASAAYTLAGKNAQQYAAVLDAISLAMKECNANMAAPPKVEVAEKLD